MDDAVSRVYAKAKEFINKSDTAGKPADGYRTYVEPDKSVYIVADKEKPLIAKWEGKDCGSDKLYCKASGSSSGAQVDLKLQLDVDWGTWKKGTSPFVYHIPIDVYYSPEDKKRDAQKKEQAAATAKRDADAKAKAEAEEKARVAAAAAKKEKDAADKRRTQAMDTAWNKELKDKKVKPDGKAAWQKKWIDDNKNRKF